MIRVGIGPSSCLPRGNQLPFLEDTGSRLRSGLVSTVFVLFADGQQHLATS